MKCQCLTRSLVSLLMLALCVPAVYGLDGFDPQGSGTAYPDNANGRKNMPPSLETHRISQGLIEIDGRLDEPDWIAAPAATGFTQFEPDRFGEPCEETVFKVIYDADAIYFGVACYRLNGEPINACLSRRDHITSSDRIRIYIDPYHDLTTGYHFRINPKGVKEDYYNYGDLYHDSSWDAVWEADTHVDDEGWYAELRIPFSSIRYRAADSMTWGFNVFQYIHSRGERTAWSNWDRDQGGFMSRSGTITGIEGIRAPRQLEITPYVVSRTTDPSDPTAHGFADEDWGDFHNIGADIKYGVTADLTLNATIQPDFGQVEADPSLLNLSPHETMYDEKRPFFIEGAQFFYHPNFIVTHSRRIGMDSENSRIRFAGKLTGKVAGDVSTAVMVAATDETNPGQTHNLFKGGDRRTVFAVGRFGKQFGNDMHSINIMQNAVIRDESSFDWATRNGYVTGGDFELNFKDRMYQINGSFVGSIVDRFPDPENPEIDPAPTYGTGGRFEVMKATGNWRSALTVKHQGDELDINDFGYISSQNRYEAQAWVTRVYNADDEESFISDASLHARWYRNWIYADRTFYHPNNPNEVVWSYKRWHDQLTSIHSEFDLYTRSCWGFWTGVNYNPEGTDIYATRWTPDWQHRGPLMTQPEAFNVWAGFNTDHRKSWDIWINGDINRDSEGSHGFDIGSGLSWTMNSRTNHNISLSHARQHSDAQWMTNLDNPGGGIADVSYIFGELDRRTWDLTLRSSVLFNRDQSLELYLQPFLTVGDYTNPRELATPDSYDLRPFPDYDAKSRDFAYGAVNLNLVYRWEYSPGSTIYLVWTHTRDDLDRRAYHEENPANFKNDFGADPLFDNEAENRFLAKISYWFSI